MAKQEKGPTEEFKVKGHALLTKCGGSCTSERPQDHHRGRRGEDPHRGSADDGVVGVLVAPVAAAIGAIAALATNYSIQ
jgi:hypothetical protein